MAVGSQAGQVVGGGTRIEAVMRVVRERIASRSLTPGAKLPSVRALSRSMAVSTSTVVEAYERLAADGVIRSRPGSGFYVAGALAPLSLADLGPRLDREVDPLWISRQSLDSGAGLLKPGCGWLPASWMPEAGLRRAMRAMARPGNTALTDYGTTLGLGPLRQLLARRMAQTGVDAAPDQIVLTESGTQAIDLICRFLLKPGDVVLVDDPCYFNFHALLRAHQVQIVGVPYQAGGPDLELFAQALDAHRPRLYVTNSAVHNPTGASLSLATAHRLLKLAEQAQLTIIEDDIFADFVDAAVPRLATIDGLERVVQIGSFSKTLSASVRCGYIAAPQAWVEGLADLKIATSFGGGNLAHELVFSVLRDGSYRRHMDGTRNRLAGAMSETMGRLADIGLAPWIMPRAGMFLWCRLPEGVDAADVARHALGENVVLAPGNAFSASGTAQGYLRFNAAQSSDPRIFDVVRRSVQQAKR